MNHHSIVQCPRCSLVFAVPERESASAEYHEYYHHGGYYDARYGQEDRRRKQTFERWLDRLERLSPQGRLLDIGAAYGEFLTLARQRGRWELGGLELAPEAASAAEKNSGAKVNSGSIAEAVYPNDHFDLITAWELLEHIGDAVSVVRNIGNWLKPGGIFAMSTPNLLKLKNRISAKSRLAFFIPPEHLLYFSRRSLRHLAREAGLQPAIVDAGIKSPLYRLGVYDWRNPVPVDIMEKILGAGQLIGLEGFQLFAVFRKPVGGA